MFEVEKFFHKVPTNSAETTSKDLLAKSHLQMCFQEVSEF